MSIPLVSNVGFTEITQALVDSNSGVLNDIAGTAKSKLPVQLFKLAENINGNLTLNNDSAQKKLILDTNGNSIINNDGAPLTTNSSVTLELKGSGDILSRKQSFTVTESSTGFTGTNTISELGNSTIAVTTPSTVVQHNTVTATIPGSVFSGAGSFGTLQAGAAPTGGTREFDLTINGVTYQSFSSAMRTAMVLCSPGDSWDNATVSANVLSKVHTNVPFSTSGNSDGIASTGTSGLSSNPTDRGDIFFRIGYSNTVGWIVGGFFSNVDPSGIDPDRTSAIGTGANTSISGFKIGVTTAQRTFTFTNNLNVNVTLSGNDPFNGNTANSGGGTAVVGPTTTTDGSFSVTASFSDNNVAIVNINDGTGSIDTSAHTGTRSTRAF